MLRDVAAARTPLPPPQPRHPSVLRLLCVLCCPQGPQAAVVVVEPVQSRLLGATLVPMGHLCVRTGPTHICSGLLLQPKTLADRVVAAL